MLSPPSGGPRPTPPTPSSGSNRLGKYVITGRLGKGGMGTVYEAEDPLLRRQVAIKILPRTLAANAEARKRFLREAQAAARLNHPNVVAVHDIAQQDGAYYIVMELVRGRSTQDMLTSRGAFPWAEATAIARDVCRGLAAAHAAGLIHRDIKPANVLRTDDGVVKLADFGLARVTDHAATRLTELGSVVGTPHFMSPEQCRAATLDERSDLYALGATYYALLTGRPPFSGESPWQVMFAHASLPAPDPRQRNPSVPEACVAIVQRAMAKQREDRYPSATALLADLEALLADQAVAPPTTTVQVKPRILSLPAIAFSEAGLTALTPTVNLRAARPTPLRQRLRWRWLLGAVLLCTLAGGLIRWWFASPDAEPTPPVVVEQPGAGERQPRQDAEIAPPIHKPNFELIREWSMTGRVEQVVLSPDGQWLAAGSSSGGVRLWNFRTGAEYFPPGFRAERLAVKAYSLAFAADNRTLAVGCGNGRGVLLWDVRTGTERVLSVGKAERVLSVAFTRNSRTVAAGLRLEPDGVVGNVYVKYWDVPSGKEPYAFKPVHHSHVTAVAFAPGDALLASGSNDKHVLVWQRSNGQLMKDLVVGISVTALAYAPDGKMLVVAGSHPTWRGLQCWDPQGGVRVDGLVTEHGACRCLAFSPDGKWLAYGNGPNIGLWRLDLKQTGGTLRGHRADVLSLTFSADGVLVSGAADQKVRQWDVRD